MRFISSNKWNGDGKSSIKMSIQTSGSSAHIGEMKTKNQVKISKSLGHINEMNIENWVKILIRMQGLKLS